jgi:CDP-glucose 4,6-dehydratase
MVMKKLFGNFFQNKKILITGHTGFIGSWLSIVLNELGADLAGYALKPHSQYDNYVVTKLKDYMVSNIGDIRNFKKLNKIFDEFQPEIIFHLAAQALVRKSYRDPKETYDVNVGGTVNVFEAFRNHASCKLMINCTTDKVYEDLEIDIGYKEEDRLGGYDPYSSSKACSELITATYRNSYYNLDSPLTDKFIASVRCGNVIGGGDWQEDRIIPDCIMAIKTNQDIIIRNPNYVRPWQYVLDPIRGFLLLAMNLWDQGKKFSGAWNFGPDYNEMYSVKNIVEKIINYIGKGNFVTPNKEEFDDLHETKILLLDNSKAFEYLCWKPIISINQAIKYICNWYTEENVDYKFDVQQVENYFNKL